MTYAASIRPSVGRGVPSTDLAKLAEIRKSRRMFRRRTVQELAAEGRTLRERAAQSRTKSAQPVPGLFTRSADIHGSGQEQAGTVKTDPDDDPHEFDACPNCDGEGYVYDCFDGFCEDAESGCYLCARRCNWCNLPEPKATPTQPGGA